MTCYNLHIFHITQQGNRKWIRQNLGVNHWNGQSHLNEEGANICKNMFKAHKNQHQHYNWFD